MKGVFKPTSQPHDEASNSNGGLYATRGQWSGKAFAGIELDEIHRRIVAGETFNKVAAASGCSTKSIQRLLDSGS
jgi:hypothetical protein